MKTYYMGYELEAHREKCMAGYDLLYFTIYRASDGYECVCDFEDSTETIRDKIKELRERVDEEEKSLNPWDEKDICARCDNLAEITVENYPNADIPLCNNCYNEEVAGEKQAAQYF